MKKHGLIIIFCSIFPITFVCSQQRGNATYYSKKLHGSHTSDGGKYHTDSMTCAHRTYPFGTYLKVRNPKNNKEVIVKVTDRGPRQKKLIIDVSYCAAEQLDIVRYGIAPVEITKLDNLPLQFIITPADSLRQIKVDSLLNNAFRTILKKQ